MPLRVSNIRLSLDEPEASLAEHLIQILGIAPDMLGQWRILRKSLDTRDKNALRFVYAVEVNLPLDEERVAAHARSGSQAEVRVEPYRQPPFIMPGSGARPLADRPVVIGSGPAGLVAAYFLAERGYGRLRGLMTSSGYVPATVAVLATGHSARDVYRMLLRRGVPMAPKPFQMGVRIEQPQETVNRVQYGAARLEEKLGAADYSLVARGRHDLFTFCMCAGGHVIPSVSEPGYFCTNGMSLSHRDSPFANSGLVVTLDPEHFGGGDILAGVRLQQTYERKA